MNDAAGVFVDRTGAAAYTEAARTTSRLSQKSGRDAPPSSWKECIPMSWIFLFFAGLFEIGWAIGLKYTDGFSKPLPTVLTVASMIISLGLLGLALKTLPVGTAYAVWTGIGTVGTALLGIWLLGEPATAIRLACIALIVCGIMGLKLAA
ncbi:multidrug transporter [Mesorhizobium sp. LSJC285A00]|nr:multidrug transporter [Mesorhizobium sp. LSJC285A00]